MTTMQDLTGRRIIVTGGASGMGAGLVRALPAMGASVVSLDLNAEVGSTIAGEAGAGFATCDVTDPVSVETAVSEAVTQLGGLDVLIHAAGVAPGSPAAEMSLDHWRSAMDINATGTFLTNQAVFPHMKEGGGAIIDFASAAGMGGYPGKAAYAAAKGAVLGWVRSIAVEWAQFGITVNAIAPAIWTPMYDTTRAAMTPEQLVVHDEGMARSIPLGGRLGDVELDFVPVMAFLASGGARFMTGQVFAIDGGGTMVR
ncbi:short-chain dehydrogenase [Nocardioides sp. Soil777]|uniref:SDR family NAD(P)-dependent oxidoreductase n=1 Tax=Nocardioides sp. Soil777 TaxID=1736409 RepID=UPI0007029D5A|nr:SDR family oxidoreductase [Nocardioides sp. Soil777]KRE98141.1 short-chain dehydrogenase [Nocardioides sp. Soil777]